MAEIQFTAAKNGLKTCCVGGTHLHSSYDPTKEAERFVSNINTDFTPFAIIVTEPALSYCVKPLREKFPNTKVGAVRFSTKFKFCDNLWDFVLYPEQIDSLLTKYGEDAILSTIFVSWTPTQKAFATEHEKAWKAIRRITKTAQDILATRSFFADRWIKNSIRFCINAENNFIIEKGNIPVLIVASGPSLKQSLPYIKEFREDFFLIALSSACVPLEYAKITPDLCISTDGSFWAKKHIARCKVPLAVSAESAIPNHLFSTLPTIPLRYGESPESDLLDLCSFKCMQGKRNGTVSGTAAELAFSITSNSVYACGLDLATCNGFQHIQPNQLEEANRMLDNRLKTRESRLYPASLNNESVKIYRQWFSTQNGKFSNRFFRLTTKDFPYKPLGNIKTMDWDEIDLNEKHGEKPRVVQVPILEKKQRIQRIKKFIEEIESTSMPDTWVSAFFPADYIMQKRVNKNMDETKAELEKKSLVKLNQIKKYIRFLEHNL